MFSTKPITRKIVIDPRNLSASQRRNLLDDCSKFYAKPIVKGTLIKAGKIFTSAREKTKEVYYEIELKADLIFQDEFDPSVVSNNTLNILNTFLKAAESDQYLPAGFHCLESESPEGTLVFHVYELKLGINARRKADKTFRYDLIDENQMRSGSFGKVCVSDSRLIRRTATSGELYIAQNDPARLIKFQTENDNNTVSSKNEYALMLRAGYFKARDYKLRVDDDAKLVSQFSMKFLLGNDLEQMIKANRHSNYLSVLDRLSISIGMIRELGKHFHGNGILHCDLKAEHVIALRCGKGNWSIKLTDLGFSQEKGAESTSIRGSYFYSAPEVFDKEYTESSDLYALAIIIAELWHDTVTQQYLGMEPQDFVSMRQSQQLIPFKLFDGLNDIPKGMQKQLSSMLTLMTLKNAHSRWTLEKCLAQLELMRYDYYTTKATPKQLKSLAYNHECALTLRKQLDKDYLHHRHQERFVMSRLLSLLNDKIEEIVDNPQAISLFTSTLGLECLYPHTTKSKLLKAVESIVASYNRTRNLYKDSLRFLNDFFESTKGSSYYDDHTEGLEILLNDAERVLKKIDKFEFDLDAIVDLNKYMRSKLAQIEQAHHYHQELHTKMEETRYSTKLK